MKIFVANLYFLVLWRNEKGDFYDTLCAKSVADTEQDTLALDAGDECKATYKGKRYDAVILAKGE